jgi:hypothetical protein
MLPSAAGVNGHQQPRESYPDHPLSVAMGRLRLHQVSPRIDLVLQMRALS